MSKSKRKLTFNMINEILPEIEEVEVVVDEERGYVLSVKPMLGFSDAMNFARSVADSCFDEYGRYMPEVFDFSLAINAMMYYAGMEEPKDFGKAYRVLMQCDIFHKVLDVIDKNQFEALGNAAMKIIGNKREENIQVNVAKMNELIGEVDRLVKESRETTDAINSGEFQKTMESFMSNFAMNANSASNAAESAQTGNTEAESNIIPLKPEG